jgi:hypothetical protein
MTRVDKASDLQNLGGRLVGDWITEATHPLMPGVVIGGTACFEWLDGEKFLILRSHNDHPDIPDGLSIIGDTDGLHMHYFDARGVFRLYEFTVVDGGWATAMGRDDPAGSFASADAPFSQRMTYRFENADQTIIAKGQLSHDDVTWEDDLQGVYRRAT